MERLQKVIAKAGIVSRRKAEELILQGKVKVNGKICTTLGTRVSNKDTVSVDGKIIEKEELVYFLLNKPRKYVCTASDEHNRNKVVDLIDCQERIFPVGRLDYDSTGMLILTNDGDFAHMLAHPRFQIPKSYRVTVKGILNNKNLMKLQNGILLDDGIKTLPAKVSMTSYDQKTDRCILEMTIFEGKNRQVRRMIEAAGSIVSKLHRTQYGCVKDENLAVGSYRRLRPHEIKTLKKMADEGIDDR
ncbi:MAG: pseudouridine synthase [Erysipelotrichaceae bacterium]|jgi:23S rRNA pseudouridine2605 synthase